MDFRKPDAPDYERVHLYNLERAQQRRAAVAELGGARALDHDDLAHVLLSDHTSARANVLRRRVLLRWALSAGIGADVLAIASATTPDVVHQESTAPLLDETGRAAAIDRGLAERFPDVAAGYSLADRAARGAGTPA